MINQKEKAKKIIADNIYMTISTCLDNKPWISPVFFAFDDDYNLYWVSNKDSRHSNNIKNNSQASIVIFNSQAPEGEGDGVYFETKVEVLEDKDEIEMAMELLGKRVTKDEFRVKKIGDVTEAGVWRIYKAVPVSISTLTEGKYINGQYVDNRIEVDLK